MCVLERWNLADSERQLFQNVRLQSAGKGEEVQRALPGVKKLPLG